MRTGAPSHQRKGAGQLGKEGANLRNDVIAHHSPGRQAVPSTLIADRFLAALVRWAAKHKPETTKIAIPTEIVTASELTQVLRALGLI